MPLVTIVTAPKPFTNPHISTIQKNAIRSWAALGPDVEVLLMGREAGMAEAAVELGVIHMPQVQCIPEGPPMISSMLQLARQTTTSPLLAIFNADVLLLPDFLEAIRSVMKDQVDSEGKSRPFLLFGARWDLDVTELLEFSPGWDEHLRSRTHSAGVPHPPVGSDYFVFPRGCYTDIPDFAIGRSAWDNWMIYRARYLGWATVDASSAILLVHQNHDYSHLPGGRPPYRLPETIKNIRLAGGRRTIFHITDASCRLQKGRLERMPAGWARFWREVEIFPLVKLHSMPLGWLVYAIFHPVLAFGEVRGWLDYKLRRVFRLKPRKV